MRSERFGLSLSVTALTDIRYGTEARHLPFELLSRSLPPSGLMRGSAVFGYQLMSNSLPSGSFIATA